MIGRPADRPEPVLNVWRHRFVTLLLGGVMFFWSYSYNRSPIVITAVPALVAWMILVERAERWRHALGWTLLIGGVLIGYGYSWLAQTIHDFGGVPMAGAWALTVVFGAAGILHGWVFIVIHRAMLSRGRRPHPMITAALMVWCEHLPIRFFPWKIGHGAVNCPPLMQAAEWGGVAGVSFVLMCLIVPVHEWMRWAFARSGPPARPKAALVTFVVGCALFGFGHLRYKQVLEEEETAKASIKVAIVQPNVGATAKRAAERAQATARARSIAAYERGSREAAKAGAELIVWPETAITDSTPIMEPKHEPHKTNGFLNARGYRFINDIGRDHAFLVGIYERKKGRARIDGRQVDQRYNAAGLRQAGALGAEWSVYRKVYLIPFGEYLPIPGLDPKKYLPQSFTMKPGATEGEGKPFSSLLAYESATLQKTLKLAPFLCYEGILPEHVRNVASEDRPDILVSLTNDSWFGDTWEPYQHLNFTRFRAVEHRAPLVRATNTGISAFVSATGDVLGDTLGVGVEGTLVRDVKLLERGQTIYVKFGHWFPWLCGIIALLAFFASLLRPREDL